MFAAGFELRDKQPFTLRVEIGDDRTRELVVGGPGPGVTSGG
ncbi:MAG TPA: hypothetical protein VKH20_08380 [Solirubrobacterales bacterium]|nr:hypothetical protein [Solirubrobacterales bacterium]